MIDAKIYKHLLTHPEILAQVKSKKRNYMIHLKRFWIDLIRVKEWRIYLYISYLLWKIKDYDRLDLDYSSVIMHATNDHMSKTNYELTAIYSEIDKAIEGNIDYYKLEIIDLIDSGATIEEIKKYLMS